MGPELSSSQSSFLLRARTQMDVLAAGLAWWEPLLGSSALRVLGFLGVRCDWLMARLTLGECLHVIMMLNLLLKPPSPSLLLKP